MQGNQVLGWSKSTKTPNKTDGVTKAINLAVDDALQQGYSDIRANVKRVNIGTTHFINAVIKRKDLQKVVCLRLCGNSTQALPPFSDFPDDLKEVVFGGYHLLNGGFEFDEKVVTEVQTEEILSTLKKLSDDGFNHVAVVGMFRLITAFFSFLLHFTYLSFNLVQIQDMQIIIHSGVDIYES